jgi:hypothetical protein
MARAPVNTNLGPAEAVQITGRPQGISAPVASVPMSAGMQLAESLSSLRPALGDFIETARQDYVKSQEEKAYDTIQGMTFEQASSAVQSGDLKKTESPWYRAAFQKQYGLAYAANRQREITTAYNNEFDKDNGNIDQFLAKYAQDDMEKFGDSEFIRAGVREGMSGLFDRIKDNQASYADTSLQTRSAEQFYTLADNAVSNAVAQGGDVNSALTALTAQHKSALGMKPEDMDNQLFTLAAGYAEKGDTKALEAVLNADPNGLGPLATRSSFAVKASGLMETAKAKAGEAGRTANTYSVVELSERASSGALDDVDRQQLEEYKAQGVISQREHEGLLETQTNAESAAVAKAFSSRLKSDALGAATDLLRSGKIATLQDIKVVNPHTGSEVSFSADELEKQVVDEQMNALAGKGATPQVMAAQMSSWGTSQKFSVWEDSMSDGYTALTSQLTTAGPDGLTTIPEPAKAGYAIWRGLEGSKALRDRHVTDSAAAQVYRDAELLEEYGAMEPEEALLASARIDRKAARDNLSKAIDRDAFAAAISSIEPSWFGMSNPAANQGDANIALEGLARVYVDRGLSPKVAVKKAAEDVSRTMKPINGVLVNVRDKFIPSNFEDIVTATLDDFVKANPKVDRDDITLWPVDGQDSWIVTDVYFNPIAGSRAIPISQLQKNPHAYSMAQANEAIKQRQ